MVETYNLKNTNTGKYKSIKNPVARGKAGLFCRTRQKAFNSLRLKNQTQNVKNQWNKVKEAVNEDCERIIKFTNGNSNYTNDFNLGYVLDIQNHIRHFDENLKAMNNTRKMSTNSNRQSNEDPQPVARRRKQKTLKRK
jgi:hypothetical protein